MRTEEVCRPTHQDPTYPAYAAYPAHAAHAAYAAYAACAAYAAYAANRLVVWFLFLASDRLVIFF